MAEPQQPASPTGRRTPMAALLAALGLLLLAWVLLWLPRVADSLRDRRLMPVIARARELSSAAERHRARRGAYPRGTEGYEKPADSRGDHPLEKLRAALGSAGLEVCAIGTGDTLALELPGTLRQATSAAAIDDALACARALAAPGAAQGTILLVVTAGDEAIAITSGPGVRVTPGLAPSAAARPDWLHVVDRTP